MRHSIKMMISRCVMLLVAPVLVACASPSVPDQYYLLSPMVQPVSASGSSSVIGVGPVTIPSYLDRSTIVTRSAANRPEVNSGYRWAEPLGENINRVVMDNLDRSGVASRLEVFPWTSRDQVDWQVVVDIDQFERQADGNVILTARWKLVHFQSGEIVAAAKYNKVSTPNDATIEGTVIAMSSLLADLTREIATRIP
ncbi:membrane integrity-associated transporter subunit PqiC [Thalassospira sp.]|uniref:PqiC family protein n=1 Tax=Thalassospira sp. TaxID=1912094 RepID=UPI001B0647A3|nr:PqiC family protein [Thalassospira sp.]MBO6807401.1 membrane integrity-associated transporter subunit PqiC [Thalassospira sp.]MBO6839926.1 membrane integrity-associated transporter subunit PqiC [Thalassospira sp.]